MRFDELTNDKDKKDVLDLMANLSSKQGNGPPPKRKEEEILGTASDNALKVWETTLLDLVRKNK